jgi:hypothetical protein
LVEKQAKNSAKKRSRYSPEQIEEFELAGGVEGGMPAGEAGNPDAESAAPPSKPPKSKAG